MPIAQYRTPIGIVRVIDKDNFISSIHFLDKETEIIHPETPLLKLAVEQMEEYFVGERRSFDFPIRQQGSDFQQEVCNVCLPSIMAKPSAMPIS